MKKCAHCHEIKSASEFHKNKRFKDGLANYCKPCKKASDLAYKSQHRERLTAYSRDYVKKHPEKTKDYHRQYHLDNIETARACRRQQYQDKKERWKVYAARRDPAKLQMHAAARRAREHAATGKFTHAEWIAVLDKYGHKCLRCGSTGKLTVDHVVPLSKGGTHTADNIQPLCVSCNCSKQNKHIDYRPSQSAAS